MKTVKLLQIFILACAFVAIAAVSSREGEVILHHIQTEVQERCPTAASAELKEYLKNGCITEETWKQWMKYLEKNKEPHYIMHAKLLLGQKTINALKSTFQSDQRASITEKHQFIRVFGEALLHKLEELRQRKAYEGLIGIARLSRLLGEHTVEFLVRNDLILTKFHEKRAYLRWRNRKNWELLRPMVGISNVKTVKDWRRAEGSHFLWSLRFKRPFSVLFSEKYRNKIDVNLTRSSFLRLATKRYDERIETLTKQWKDLFPNGKYNKKVANAVWQSLRSLGRNFKDHQTIETVDAVKRLDPMQFFHMRLSMHEFPRSKLRSYWQLIWLEGGVFERDFLNVVRKRMKDDDKFVSFIRRLRPFSGYQFNEKFRAIGRLFHQTRFAFDLLNSRRFITDARLDKLCALFQKRFGADNGIKLFELFTKTFIKFNAKGYKVLKQIQHLRFLVQYFTKNVGAFATLDGLKEELRGVFGKDLGYQIFRLARARWIDKVNFGYRFSKRMRVALQFYKSNKLNLIRRLVKRYGRHFTSKELDAFTKKIEKDYVGPVLDAMKKKRIFRFVRKIQRQGLRVTDKLEHNIRSAVVIRDFIKKNGIVLNNKTYPLLRNDIYRKYGPKDGDGIMKTYFHQVESFVVRTEEDISGLESFGSSKPRQTSRDWQRLPDLVKKFVTRRNFYVTKDCIEQIEKKLKGKFDDEKAKRYTSMLKRTLTPGGKVYLLTGRGRRDVLYADCLEPLLPDKKMDKKKHEINEGILDDVQVCIRRRLGAETEKKVLPLIKKRLQTTYVYKVYDHVYNEIRASQKRFKKVVKGKVSKLGSLIDGTAFFGLSKDLEKEYGPFEGLRIFLQMYPFFEKTPKGFKLNIPAVKLIAFAALINYKDQKHAFSNEELKKVKETFKSKYRDQFFKGSWVSFQKQYFSEITIYREDGKKGSVLRTSQLLARRDKFIREYGSVKGEKKFKDYRAKMKTERVLVLNSKGAKLASLYANLKHALGSDAAIKSKTMFQRGDMDRIAIKLVEKHGHLEGAHQFLMLRRSFHKVFSMKLIRKRLTSTLQSAHEKLQNYQERLSQVMTESEVKKIAPKLQKFDPSHESETLLQNLLDQDFEKVHEYRIDSTDFEGLQAEFAQIHGFVSLLQQRKGVLAERHLAKIEELAAQKYGKEEAQRKIDLLRKAVKRVDGYRMKPQALVQVLQSKPEYRRYLEEKEEESKIEAERGMSEGIRQHAQRKYGKKRGNEFYYGNEDVIHNVISALSEINIERRHRRYLEKLRS